MKKIFLSIIISLIAINAYSTHIIGGEVSYTCLGGNLYEFKVKIYRDCFNGVPPLDAPAYFTIFNSSNVVVYNDTVSLLVDTLIPLVSQSNCLLIPADVCLEEGTYIFYTVLPPSPGGYTVVYQRCCRSGLIINLNSPGIQGSTYFAELNDAVLTLCNTSAVFSNYPAIYICANEPLVYDHSAFDADGDSLVYSLMRPYQFLDTGNFSQPIIANPPPYTGIDYIMPYTAMNPMDGNPALSINSSGVLTITPTALGQYVVGISVSEYRNGVFLGTHFRDFQFHVVNCNSMAGFLNTVYDQTLIPGDTAHFVANASNINESLQWQENAGSGFNDLLNGAQYSGVTTDTLTINNVTLNQNNNSYRCYAYTDSCSDTTNAGLLNVIPDNIIELINSGNIVISPNPSMGLFSVQFNLVNGYRDFKIENTMGQIILEQKINTEKLLQIDLTGIPDGVYFLRLRGEQIFAVKRIVIE